MMLLNNSKLLLRKLETPVEWGDSKECVHTEAYYLYRTLLVRQLAVLSHERRDDEVIINAINKFVTNTLQVNPDVVLDDVYFYGRSLPENQS